MPGFQPMPPARREHPDLGYLPTPDNATLVRRAKRSVNCLSIAVGVNYFIQPCAWQHFFEPCALEEAAFIGFFGVRPRHLRPNQRHRLDDPDSLCHVARVKRRSARFEGWVIEGALDFEMPVMRHTIGGALRGMTVRAERARRGEWTLGYYHLSHPYPLRRTTEKPARRAWYTRRHVSDLFYWLAPAAVQERDYRFVNGATFRIVKAGWGEGHLPRGMGHVRWKGPDGLAIRRR